MANETEVRQFIFIGLKHDSELQYVIFAIFLLCYVTTLVGNGSIIFVVVTEPRLHTPMYFFLGNLSCLDMCFSTVTVPKMLAGLLSEKPTISFSECMLQLFFYYFIGSGEGILLAVMAYDRYVAICNPLRYPIIMRKEIYVLLTALAWSVAFLHGLVQAMATACLPFCGPNQIEHFLCDIKPLLKLACGNAYLNLMLLSIGAGCIGMGPFIVILLSYLYIIIFLFFKVKSQRGWQKAFSTCGSHLTVVTLFYVPILLNYLLPTVGTSSQREIIITFIYSAVTPALNPLIYSLRNKEVKMSMKKLLDKNIFSFW